MYAGANCSRNVCTDLASGVHQRGVSRVYPRRLAAASRNGTAFAFKSSRYGSGSGSIRATALNTPTVCPAWAFSKLPTQSAILDGDLCLIDHESELMFLAFDLLHQDGVDLRGLPLSERKRDLDRLCRRSKVPRTRRVETLPDGEVLFDHCNKFGFEGVLSKRLVSRHSSGPSRNWVKVKCPDWKRVNAGRHKLFEGPRKPEQTECQLALAKKREELARVSNGCERQGIARELHKHLAILEREIAKLELA
jgi:ATP dependent DNA ligase domain